MNPFSRSLLLVAVSLMFAALGAQLRGQENWSVVTTPTDRNLWSVCYGGGQFVAVGEAGTILTSPDGLTWTKRSSGNALWLVGVCHGNGLFVVVGDQGTILTSPDGVTWTTRRTGGTRINAVAFGNGFFLAVDEGGGSWKSTDGSNWSSSFTYWSGTQLRGLVHVPPTFVVTGANGRIQITNDGIEWTPRAINTTAFIESIAYGRGLYVVLGAANLTFTSRDTATWAPQQNAPAYFHGVGYFNGQFVGATDKGFVVTSADGKTWTTRNTGSTQLLIAVANSDAIGIVVGFGGTILRSSAAPRAPTIIEDPESLVEAVGSNVLFEVAAAGSEPISYQWFLNGNAISGATREALFLRSIQPSQSGRYSVSVKNSFGVATSNPGVLAVLPSPPPTTSIIDPTFTATPPPTAAPKAIVEQPDGRIVIGGNFIYLVDGAPQTGVARLQADGSLDTSFKIGKGIDGVGASVDTIAIQGDGKILIAGVFSSVAGVPRSNLARLSSDGEVDASFIPLVPSSVGKIISQPDGKILYLSGTTIGRLNSDGSKDVGFSTSNLGSVPVYSFTASRSSRRIIALSGGYLRAYTEAGALDPTFASVLVSDSISTAQYPLGLLEIVGNEKILFGGGWAITNGSYEIKRVNSDGSPDLTFAPIRRGLYYNSSLFTLDSTQRIIVIVSPSTSGGGGQLIRYDRDGRTDSTFRFNANVGPAYTWFKAFPVSGDRLLLSGNFATIDGIQRSTLARTVASNAGQSNPPKVSPEVPTFASVDAGSTVTLDLSPAGTPPFYYSYSGDYSGSGQNTVSFSGSSMSIKNAQRGGVYAIRITNAAGDYTHYFTLGVKPSSPSVIASPMGLSVSPGRTAIFNVSTLGSDPRTYQWFFDNTPIGSSSSTLTVSNVTARNAGTYTVVIRNSLGTTTASARLTVEDSSRLANLATRGQTGPGENVLIVGFVVSGPSAKTVLLRGIGPTLGAFGLTGTIGNPVLSLFDSAGSKIAENDNWATPSQGGVTSSVFSSLGAFPLASNSLDAALQRTLEPGRYTAQLTDAAGRSGVGLVEVYENDLMPSRLVNLSSRVLVGPGSSLAIPGIVVRGSVPQRLLIRAVGPTLASFGVQTPLDDSGLTVVNSANEIITENDDWSSAANATEVASVSAKVGAFALPAGSKDAAVLVSLPPGNYTALVSGAGGASGIALVEVYEVP